MNFIREFYDNLETDSDNTDTLTKRLDDMAKSRDDLRYALHESGFNGELYASYGEFLNTEYLDENYIRTLLNDKEYKEYLADINNS